MVKISTVRKHEFMIFLNRTGCFNLCRMSGKNNNTDLLPWIGQDLLSKWGMLDRDFQFSETFQYSIMQLTL